MCSKMAYLVIILLLFKIDNERESRRWEEMIDGG